MKPDTLSVIEKVWEFRRNTSANLFFTLDAGANVHLLYPENEKDKCLELIKNELKSFCNNGKFIEDFTF